MVRLEDQAELEELAELVIARAIEIAAVARCAVMLAVHCYGLVNVHASRPILKL